MYRNNEKTTGYARGVISRRGLIGVCGVALTAVCGARIAWVNEHAVHIPEVTYGMHKWLDMDECYLGTDDDIVSGYGMMVEDAEIMSPNEYLARYGQDGVTTDTTQDADNPCVLTVTMRIRNQGVDDERIGIKAYMWQVVPEERPNTVYYVDTALFGHARPTLAGGGGFRVIPGEEPVAPIPFAGFAWPHYFEPFDETYRPDITGGSFRLAMTDLPERRLFRFTV